MSAMENPVPLNDRPENTQLISSPYQAAWSEHGMRIAQRQAVIQWYLSIAGALYGYWFVHQTEAMNKFLGCDYPSDARFVTLNVDAQSGLTASRWLYERL
jgi:hypothetical protein